MNGWECGSESFLPEGTADAKVQRGGVGRKWGQEGEGQGQCVQMRLQCQQGPVMKGYMCLESHLDVLLRKRDKTAMDSHGRCLLPQGNGEWHDFPHSAEPRDWMICDIQSSIHGAARM